MSPAAVLGGLAAAAAVAGLGLLAASIEAERLHAMRLLAGMGARAGVGVRGRATPPRDLEARIAAAGRPAGLGSRELMAAKLAASALGAGAGVVLAAAAGGHLNLLAAAAGGHPNPLAAGAGGRLSVLALLGGPVAGFLAPDLWLARRAAERARRIRHQLPALLDLLRVMVESGGSLAAALDAVGARTHGPLATEWRAVAREVALGVPLERALAGLARRAPLPEVEALTAALERARRHGVPLSDTLAAQARDARFALARHAREEAARAGPKIQLVVALLLVPSVLLLVAAALLAGLTGGGSLLPL